MSNGDWSRGYPVSDTYPASWHTFQSPAYLRLICALAGVAWEVGPETPLNILELGCGTGYTAQMLAAGNPLAQVVGLDYNPAHVAEARSLAAEAGLKNVSFIEADLAEMTPAELDALPEFDLVTVHGLWSWVADPVREGVVRLLQRRLKAGGLVMMGYNALPGAAGAMGLARVVKRSLQGRSDAEGGVQAAVQRVKALLEAKPAHLPSSGWLRMLTGELAGVRSGYLLHEFLTEYWRPAFQSDVAAALGAARCEYAGSASIDENFPALSLTEAQRAQWEQAADGIEREFLFDLFVPRAFRRDVYVRGLRRVPRDAAVEGLWLASASRQAGAVQLRTQAGEAELPEALVNTVREALARGPHSLAALRALPGCGGVTPAELAAMLVGSRVAVPFWRTPGGPGWDEAVGAARRLNVAAAQRFAPYGVGATSFGLATPALAGGLAASAMELAVARVLLEGGLVGQGVAAASAIVQRLLPPALEAPPPEVLQEAQSVVAGILRDRLPDWQALGIV